MIAVSSDWRRALIAESDNRVRLWDLARGLEIAVFTGHYKNVTAGFLSDDGRFGWTGDKDGWVIQWRLPVTGGANGR